MRRRFPALRPGRSWGIIDGLHLIEIPPAIMAMEKSPAFTPELVAGLKQWFQAMADWMMTSKNGQAEAAAKNNHSVAFWLQIACYARFTGDEAKLAECRRQFKEVFVPKQMAVDGSFPLELKRTKPYGYSIFQLDNMATLCQVLSTPRDNLWIFKLPDGRGMRQAMKFLYPYLADKSNWPYRHDVQAWGTTGPPGSRVCYLPGWSWMNQNTLSFGKSCRRIPRIRKCAATLPLPNRSSGFNKENPNMLMSLLFAAIITWALFEKIFLSRGKSIFSPSATANGFKRLPLRCQKTGHIWISALFLLQALTLSSRADQFDDLRLYWQNYLISTGGSPSSIASTANSYWSSMNTSPTRTYLWSDLPLGSVSANIVSTFQRLQAMALGWATPGSSLQGNASLASAVVSGLDWMKRQCLYHKRDRV